MDYMGQEWNQENHLWAIIVGGLLFKPGSIDKGREKSIRREKKEKIKNESQFETGPMENNDAVQRQGVWAKGKAWKHIQNSSTQFSGFWATPSTLSYISWTLSLPFYLPYHSLLSTMTLRDKHLSNGWGKKLTYNNMYWCELSTSLRALLT